MQNYYFDLIHWNQQNLTELDLRRPKSFFTNRKLPKAFEEKDTRQHQN